MEVLKTPVLSSVFYFPNIFLSLRPTVLLLEVYTFGLDFLPCYKMQISTPGDGLLHSLYCPLVKQLY